MVKSKRSWSFQQKASKSKVTRARTLDGENIDLELGPVFRRSSSCPTGEKELQR